MPKGVIGLRHTRHSDIPVPVFVTDGQQTVLLQVGDHDGPVQMRQSPVGVESETLFSALIRHLVDKMVHVGRVCFPDGRAQTDQVIVFHHLVGSIFQLYDGDICAGSAQAFLNVAGNQHRIAGLRIIDDQYFHDRTPFRKS